MTYVYVLIEGMQVRYVGYSENIERRRRNHLSAHPEWQFAVLGNYPDRTTGLENEKRWIRLFQEAGHQLINVSEGGEYGKLGRKVTRLTRDKLSVSMTGKQNRLGKRHSLETRSKISLAHIGKHHSFETRVKLSVASKGNRGFLGKHHSQETRMKMSKTRKGKPLSLETRVKMSLAKIGNKNAQRIH